jgi:FkbM family methyltransferase
MNRKDANLFVKFGERTANLGYLIANPSYAKVRNGKGCGELYKLMNRSWFSKRDIQLVLDVGAHQGLFIETVLALLPDVEIYAFEPHVGCAEQIKAVYPEAQVKVFPVALGSKSEDRALRISHFSPASSLLASHTRLLQEFPETAVDQVVPVHVKRLDEIEEIVSHRPFKGLLKIDVQGFELEVLQGSVRLFDQIAVIICEANLASLYQEQATLAELITFLESHHYRLLDMTSPIRSPVSQEILYLDLAFIRDE